MFGINSDIEAEMLRHSILTIFIVISTTIITRGEELKTRLFDLPPPSLHGDVSLEEALKSRKSTREFAKGDLTLQQFSQILWATQGLIREDFYRTAPSAGALYPLEIYIAVEKVTGLNPGLYHYLPQGHRLKLERSGSLLSVIAKSAYRQETITSCAVAFIISGVVERTAKKYHERAQQYVLLEVGHSAQNLLLQATALNLGCLTIGAFHEDELKKDLALEGIPYYIIPIGRK
jgi:SagB-type dehydrogenase family enzyme